MMNIDLKAIFYTIGWGLLALSLGDLTEHYFGWDPVAVSHTIMVMVLVWVWSDLNLARRTLAETRAKVRVALDKLEAMQR